uniref:EF-hand domain-containing protein n=1 Tax=Amphimedon queenslandica TaxID=400682 RepID=A0A1X7V468_AMPQE
MGNRKSLFDQDRLNAYQECTYFTEKQIKKLYKRFSSLNSKKINPRKANVDARLSFSEMQQLPELKENPFKDRICAVFSTNGRGISFEDFLDMCSVFSAHAPWELKASYAFRIFDFDSDAFLSSSDIEQILSCITI